MQPFWETEWQGIVFSEIASTSETELAGAEFYNAFYRELYGRYAGYDDLAPSWRNEKRELVTWLRGQLTGPSRVLSVGCGLGYMECLLHESAGERIELHVSEYAIEALRWIRERMPADRIHDETSDSLSDATRRFDLIYLSAVDYALPQAALVNLLRQQRERLAPSGACVLISASYMEENPSLRERVLFTVKATARRIIGRRPPAPGKRGQLWGWKRTRSEYRAAMLASGFATFNDGFIETRSQRTYFIRGRA